MPARPPTSFALKIFDALQRDFDPLVSDAGEAYQAFWAASGLPLSSQYRHVLPDLPHEATSTTS